MSKHYIGMYLSQISRGTLISIGQRIPLPQAEAWRSKHHIQTLKRMNDVTSIRAVQTVQKHLGQTAGSRAVSERTLSAPKVGRGRLRLVRPGGVDAATAPAQGGAVPCGRSGFQTIGTSSLRRKRQVKHERFPAVSQLISRSWFRTFPLEPSVFLQTL